MNVTEVRDSDFKNAFPGIFNFTVGILFENQKNDESGYKWVIKTNVVSFLLRNDCIWEWNFKHDYRWPRNFQPAGHFRHHLWGWPTTLHHFYSLETGHRATPRYLNCERRIALLPVPFGAPWCSVIGYPLTNKRLKMTHAPLLIIFKWLNLVTNPRHFQYYKILKIFSRHKSFLKMCFTWFCPIQQNFLFFILVIPHHILKIKYFYLCLCLFIFTMKSWKRDIGPLVFKGSGSAWDFERKKF